ncbi:hypothetical protein B1R32_10470 [Abditibacterium utsteinense]|uniref:Uncharacterized protein n=2 Tax=Abditibacterium utsteinense TaxID=1960156 RepID=A0A2S8SUU8_9BACT|nr:hypothetical protein B1R32_10470 [Abditibacterium utsteinense]
MATAYAYYSLLPPQASAAVLSNENILIAGLQKLPISVVLGALSGSTLAAWRASDKVRVRRNTRWSVIVALVVIAWLVFVPLYMFASGDTSASLINQLLIGPASVPWVLKFVFLSLNLNLPLLWALILAFIGWAATQKLEG